MKIVRGLTNFKNEGYKNIIMSLGKFDGVHLGHQKIIEKITNRAKEIKGTSLILTFEEHPLKIVNPEACPPQLCSFHEKINLFKELGIDVLILINFDQHFATITPYNFVFQILFKKIKCKEIYIGKNFHFGKSRKGDASTLIKLSKKFNINVKIMREVKFKDKIISSTEIRKLVKAGEIKLLRKLLNRFYSIYGRVIPGEKRGKKLGFPTANLLTSGILLPPTGVYIAKIEYKKKEFGGMVNIGFQLTFKSKTCFIEVHILNFKANIYQQFIKISLIEKIREEKAFANISSLKNQLNKDKVKTNKILQKYKIWKNF